MTNRRTHCSLTKGAPRLHVAACASLLLGALSVTCGSGGSESSGGASSSGGSNGEGTGGAGTGGETAASGGESGMGTGGDGTTGSVIPGTDHYDCSPPSGELPPLKLVEYATGFNSPLLVTHAPNDTERLFVVEQPGVIQVVKGGVKNPEPFLDIQSQVSFGGNSGGTTWEQGLLGLAFHPDYDENGLFYVHYDSWEMDGYDNGTAIVSEFRVDPSNPDLADPASERIVFTAPTLNGFHNGGTITFGPDGMLYIGLGDGGGRIAPTDPDGSVNGQDVTNVRGGVSRINPLQSGSDPYTVPAGNLKDSIPNAAPELWNYGLRNPYRMNFDACTGVLYIGDVGQAGWEEINIEPAGVGHRNYGWATMEGPECYQPATGCDTTGITLPHVAYEHPQAQAFRAVIGGAVYRGRSIPALRGTYFFTDLYGDTRIFVYDPTNETTTDVVSLESQLNPAQVDQGLTAIQNGGDGELYFVSRGSSSTDPGQVPPGVVYRLEVDQ